MSAPIAFLILALAALLEAGGDAVVRSGLHASSLVIKVGLILLGGVVLLAYGVVVNGPPWDFGRLLGVLRHAVLCGGAGNQLRCVRVSTSVPILVGGVLIFTGALLMTVWH